MCTLLDFVPLPVISEGNMTKDSKPDPWTKLKNTNYRYNIELHKIGGIKKMKFFYFFFRCQILFCTTQQAKWTDFIAK